LSLTVFQHDSRLLLPEEEPGRETGSYGGEKIQKYRFFEAPLVYSIIWFIHNEDGSICKREKLI